MVLGRDTFAGDVLARLGVRNVFADHADRYPKLAKDDPATVDADLVVFPDEPYAFTPDDGPEAWPHCRPAFVSGRHLTWYGPSLAEAPAVLVAQLSLTPASRCQTATVLLANAVALLHAAAVLFMLTGSLLALRWPWVLWLHVPVSLAILGLYLTGSDCPLTTWELALREQAGEPGYTGGFIGHYITEPLGFPIEATSTQVGISSSRSCRT